MTRYVIAMTRTTDCIQQFEYQAFEVLRTQKKYDVPIPPNTMFFIFASADVENIQELQNSLTTVQIGDMYVLSTDLELHLDDPMKRYWIGKQVLYEDDNYFFCTRANVLVPFQMLDENDEMIDL